MAQPEDRAEFTFSWLALRLLGRGLYSNPWSALSELVANGFDAGARRVHVYVDARDKAHALVEVVDDGSGMSRQEIDIYVKVGHNKRKHAAASGVAATDDVKGRKGIGKLAAMFLSDHFYLETRSTSGESSWELDAQEEHVRDEDFPELIATSEVPATENEDLWNSLRSGTRLIMQNVDLTGYGPQSIAALGARLANQFLLGDESDREILLWVRNTENESRPAYEPVAKNIAFKNFATIASHFDDPQMRPREIQPVDATVSIPAKGLPGDEFVQPVRYLAFPSGGQMDEAWGSIEQDVDRDRQTYKGVAYSLTGWIGVHATIDSASARANDERFVKNKYYNPAQLRVYVRGKLANDRLLSQLGITGTYANYIEGEISFDVLDADSLPDIATSNRQDFDETDGRVTLLRALVRPIVRMLMQDRNNLAAKVNELTRAEKDRRNSQSKRHFAEQLRSDLQSEPDLSQASRDNLHTVITNKIQGEIAPKEDYRVFISHSSEDAPFAQLIDELLQSRGAFKGEIFYTSREGDITNAMKKDALAAIIKDSITNSNTLIFYLTSKNFSHSEYCLFEGGAGWATRAVNDYLKLNVEYESIPDFLSNGQTEVTLLDKNMQISLTTGLHNYLIDGVLNPMIEHLNRGRNINGQTGEIAPFVKPVIPSAIELARQEQRSEDYLEVSLKEHWELLVEPTIPAYIEAYTAGSA